MHCFFHTKPRTCDGTPYDGRNGENQQQVSSRIKFLCFCYQSDRCNQDQAAVTGITDDHCKEQGEKQEKPEGDI